MQRPELIRKRGMNKLLFFDALVLCLCFVDYVQHTTCAYSVSINALEKLRVPGHTDWTVECNVKVIPLFCIAHRASLLRIIYGVISTRSCTRAMKNMADLPWYWALFTNEHGHPTFFCSHCNQLIIIFAWEDSSDSYCWKLNK